MNWILILVIAIIAINAYIGKKMGLIKVVFSMFSIIISIFLTMTISPRVNHVLQNNKSLYNKVYGSIEKTLEERDDKSDKEKTLEEPDNKADQEKTQEDFINKLSIPLYIKKGILAGKYLDGAKGIELTEEISNKFKVEIYTHITKAVINAIAFIVTFIVISILLWCISLALNIIAKLPVLNSINSSAGLAVGVLQGLIIVWLIFIVITASSSFQWGKEAMAAIESNKVLTILYNSNIILEIVGKSILG